MDRNLTAVKGSTTCLHWHVRSHVTDHMALVVTCRGLLFILEGSTFDCSTMSTRYSDIFQALQHMF